RAGHVTGVQTCALPICRTRWGRDGSPSPRAACISLRSEEQPPVLRRVDFLPARRPVAADFLVGVGGRSIIPQKEVLALVRLRLRSEERRGGRECRSRAG